MLQFEKGIVMQGFVTRGNGRQNLLVRPHVHPMNGAVPPGVWQCGVSRFYSHAFCNHALVGAL
jgi:hypothetical protein